MHVRLQILCPPHERDNRQLMQERLATRNRQAIEQGASCRSLLKLAHDIPTVRQEVLVAILIRVEAEIAMSRAAQIYEKRGRALARAARQAGRRNPSTP